MITLTVHEFIVARALVACGLRDEDLASLLNKSVYTVKSQIKSVLAKSGCHGRLEFVVSVWSGAIRVSSPRGVDLLTSATLKLSAKRANS